MKARRMQPDERGVDRLQVAHDDGDRLVARLVLNPVADDPARAVTRRQIGFGDPVNQLFTQAAVLDQRLDRDDRQPVLARDRMKPIAAGDAGAVEHLAEDARRRQARQSSQVNGRLGMPGPAKHAAILGHQAETGGRDGPGRQAWSRGR